MKPHKPVGKEFILSKSAKEFRRIRRIDNKGNPCVVKAKGSWKISIDNKISNIIDRIVTPLEKIIYLYIPTNYYNYIPGTKKDCWNYMEKKIQSVYCNLNSMVFLNASEYDRLKRIIETVHAFVRGYSGVDSIIDKHWFELNPNLNFFRSCYYFGFVSEMKQWTEDDFEIMQSMKLFDYFPDGPDDVIKRDDYMEYLHCHSRVRNFKWDKFDNSDCSHEDSESIMLMHEIAYTLRLVFIDVFHELCD